MHGYKSARKWSLNGNLLQTRKDCALKKIYASDGDTCVIDLSATMRNKKKVDHLHQRRGKMNITMNYYFWWNQGPFDQFSKFKQTKVCGPLKNQAEKGLDNCTFEEPYPGYTTTGQSLVDPRQYSTIYFKPPN
ncbi:uncharacterized protein [Engystomops pustulosus]|uniref:uncharacterized protein isoform X3 n=1 Tax=Engystomops pustulosus TaxID=76066 RepID=UPI003AFB1E4B